MEDIIQLFRKLKKSKSHQNGLDLDLASPSSASNSEANANKSCDLQKAKFKLKKPRLTSPTERRIQQQKLRNSSAASVVSSATSEVINGSSPFADEDDLFADRDDGVYMQSSSTSSSPAASERLMAGSKLQNGGCNGRPASCTFGGINQEDFRSQQRLFQPRTTFQTSSQSTRGRKVFCQFHCIFSTRY